MRFKRPHDAGAPYSPVERSISAPSWQTMRVWAAPPSRWRTWDRPGAHSQCRRGRSGRRPGQAIASFSWRILIPADGTCRIIACNQ
ncbi:hypothetical protein [Lysobacter gummosus]|uniref:hypothetical protein n=1 Tax=Lysobacter gummosus TaxID=262324 RepID=UPI003636E0A2